MTYEEAQAAITAEQQATIDRMLAAPAGGWVRGSTYAGTLLGQPCENVAVKLASRKLGVWGVVMPDGSFVKPNPGRKTINVSDIVFAL